MTERVAVVGGGRFGRGLAMQARRVGHDVVLVTRRVHGVDLPAVRIARDLGDVVDARLVLLAVPSTAVEDVADALGQRLDGRHLIVHVSRGLIGDELLTVTQVLRQRTPCRRLGALAGPLQAEALAEGRPGGGVVGTRFPEVTEATREALGDALRLYETDDVVGVEVASAMVGLLAIAAGYARGRGVSPSLLAVLVSRGMAEAARVGRALGAVERTFGGLAGFGDFVSVVAGDQRPELLVGEALATGEALDDAARAAGAHVEAIRVAGQIAAFGERAGVATPITRIVAEVLDGRLSADEAIARLMARAVEKE